MCGARTVFSRGFFYVTGIKRLRAKSTQLLLNYKKTCAEGMKRNWAQEGGFLEIKRKDAHEESERKLLLKKGRNRREGCFQL